MEDRNERRDLAKKHGLTVLYEDNHMLVLEKPQNLPVQADASGDPDLLSIAKGYLREAGNKPGEAYLGLVHRLDRPVGGVMVFAKTSKAAARLTAQFKSHTAKKRYAAITDGAAKPAAYLTDWLCKDERTHSSFVVPEGTAGAKLAKLSYETIGTANGQSLVDISLYTGRPHQIRVQLSHAGLPIVGDQRYHPAAVAAARGEAAPVRTQICLWAYALTIEHPTLGERMTFFSVPHGAFWNRFPAGMAVLPAFSVCSGVYLDDSMLVVDKRVGVEVEGELLSELSSLFPELYPVHRLDANTTGLVLFARTPAMRDTLETLFREHRLKKIYHALVAGTPPQSGRLVHYAVKDAEEATVRLAAKDAPGAQRMELDYRVLQSENGCSLVEIDLHTGRTHQIRVQMAAIGHPVLGDDKYGDRETNRRFRCRTQQLLCKRMEAEGHVFESCKSLPFPKARGENGADRA